MSKKRLIFALAAGLAVLAAAPEVVNDSPGVTVDLAARGKSSSFRRGAIPPERRRAQKRYNAFLRPG